MTPLCDGCVKPLGHDVLNDVCPTCRETGYHLKFWRNRKIYTEEELKHVYFPYPPEPE